ncbi:MAG: DUF4430 domain-containing protein [Ruminococcaceae bacterium]|nr:DUF4430 domain-containing protein [Oscillospiraceae bacterium]
MKNSVKALLLALLLVISAVFCAGCSNNESPEQPEANISDNNGESSQGSSVWDSAEYKEDAEVGEGAITVKVEVVAEEKSVTITLHTDKDNLGAALLDNNLVSGDESEYGLYIKFVIGMEADYDKDGTYWSLSKDGEYLMTGADSTPIADGEHYEFTRTKG